MKRKEEIDKVAFEYAQSHSKDRDDAYLTFKNIAEWADKTMLNKAREWVKNAFVGPFGEGLANSIADEFVKAMEE